MLSHILVCCSPTLHQFFAFSFTSFPVLSYASASSSRCTLSLVVPTLYFFIPMTFPASWAITFLTSSINQLFYRSSQFLYLGSHMVSSTPPSHLSVENAVRFPHLPPHPASSAHTLSDAYSLIPSRSGVVVRCASTALLPSLRAFSASLLLTFTEWRVLAYAHKQEKGEGKMLLNSYWENAINATRDIWKARYVQYLSLQLLLEILPLLLILSFFIIYLRNLSNTRHQNKVCVMTVSDLLFICQCIS